MRSEERGGMVIQTNAADMIGKERGGMVSQNNAANMIGEERGGMVIQTNAVNRIERKGESGLRNQQIKTSNKREREGVGS